MNPHSLSELVLADDFAGYATGPLSEDVDPVHETHYLPKSIEQGPWTETSVYHTNRWPNIDIRWVIAEHEGRKVLKQTGTNKEGVLSLGNFVRRHVLRRDLCPILFFPSLTAGSRAWRDYRVEASLVPLSRELCGVLFRSATSMEHYIFGLENGRARLLVRRFNTLRVLASRRHALRDGTSVSLSVSVAGSTIRCQIDGLEIFSVEDDACPQGGCGVLANGPAVFESFAVYMTPADRAALAGQPAAEFRVAGAIPSPYPGMKLERRIALPVTAPGRSIRFGDLSGGGETEYLVVQAGQETRDSALSLTAVDTRGRIMWQRGGARTDRSLRIRDVPVQIYDIDGDGRSEVICYSEGALHILDGATGTVKHSAPGPAIDGGRDAGRRLDGDSIFICNLAGAARASDLLIKDVYSRIYAFDARLEPRWGYACKTGHYPFALDVNGDGRDEVLIGYTLLDAGGRRCWSLALHDHADAVAIITPPSTGERVVAIAASNEGFVLADIRGKRHRHLKIGHMQTITAGRLAGGSGGIQIATNTYWGNPGVIYILDLDGTIANVFQPSIHGSPLSPVRWTRGAEDCILLSAAAGPEGGLYDARGAQVAAFPDDGHPELCYFVCDVDGDGLDEIVCWHHDELRVYRSEETGPAPATRPVRLPAPYNQSNYRSQVTQ